MGEVGRVTKVSVSVRCPDCDELAKQSMTPDEAREHAALVIAMAAGMTMCEGPYFGPTNEG